MAKGYKGRNPRGAKKKDDDDDSDKETRYVGGNRGLGTQSSNVGMMPPSDSESEEDSGDEGPSGSKPEEKAKPAPKPQGQPKTAGLIPPSDSSDDDSSSGSDSDPMPEYLRAAPAPKKKTASEEPRDPEQIRKDLERLELIKKKREQDRLKRIADEGWDRFAPVSETNKPPGHALPSDHPSHKEK